MSVVVGWIKMPLGTEVGLSPGDIVLDGNPALPPKGRGAQQPPPHFSAQVAKQSPISATAEQLSAIVMFHNKWRKRTSGELNRVTQLHLENGC